MLMWMFSLVRTILNRLEGWPNMKCECGFTYGVIQGKLWEVWFGRKDKKEEVKNEKPEIPKVYRVDSPFKLDGRRSSENM
jgi:hypothetical protein